MTIKGSLLLSVPIVKHFQAKTKSSFGPKWGINRGLIVNFSFITPKNTSLRDFTSFELSRVKIHQQV